MGWLHATPRTEKSTHRPRIERMEAVFPDVKDGQYLVDAWQELGLIRDGVLPWAEIAAYSQMGGKISKPWEARVMRRMSRAYLDGKRRGEDPMSIAPYGES